MTPKTVRPSLDISWSERSRAFEGPSSALSATITYVGSLPNEGDLTFTVDRPTNPAAATQTYPAPTPVELGPTTVRVVFHAAAGGQGAVVGTAQTTAVISEGGRLTDGDGAPLGRIVFAGTIDKVVIPTGQFVRVGETKTFSFQAEDAEGNIVAVSPGSFKTQSGPEVEVSPEGTMTGKAVGTPQVTVSVDGKTAQGWVTVDIPESEAVRTYHVKANNLVYSSLTERIYASVSETDPLYGNRIVTLDPNRPGVLASTAIGEEPGAMAIGADGRTIHVSLNKEFAIRQFDAQTGVAGVKFNPASGGNPTYAEDIAPHPTMPGTIVASLISVRGDSTGHESVAVFDNGVARPVRAVFGDEFNRAPTNRVEWSDQEGVVYGLNNETTEFGLCSFAVNSEGITKSQNLIDSFGRANSDIAFRDGRIYCTFGVVVDPASPHVSNRLWSEFTNMPLAVDSNARRYYSVSRGEGIVVNVYDLDSRTLIESKTIVVPSSYMPKEVVAIGPSRLAITMAGGPLIVVDLAKLPGNGG